METKFLTFINPYLSYIDDGELFRKPFSWLYGLLGLINLVLPIYIFYQAVNTGVFDSGASYIIVFLLVWIIIVFASWISFQLWWDRKSKVIATSSNDDEFVATPVFSHFIQTTGEWLGTWIIIVGFSYALLTTIFLGGNALYLSAQIGIPFLRTGFPFIILMPVYGFLIIAATRFLAEQIRAVASIAKNTRRS